MANAIALLTSKTDTGAGASQNILRDRATFQASVVGTGSVSATVLVEVSNDGTYWATLATFTLSGTTSATDVFAVDAPYVYVRGNISAITGTNAAVTLTAGV